MIIMRLLLLLSLLSVELGAQEEIFPVYAGEVPCATHRPATSRDDAEIGLVLTDVAVPELYHFAPVPRASRSTAIMVIPGGGYYIEAWDLEGVDIARFLAAEGYDAFVLRHRLPGTLEGPCKDHVALEDAQQALLTVRGLADTLGFAADRVGIMGFSAGGHLAGSASVHWREAGGTSSRPDFSVLVYPVLIMNERAEGHAGSQQALLGSTPDPDRLSFYNLPAQVTADSPPALLIHASDDEGVPVRNSIRYYEALLQQGVAADLRVYATGGHGFGAARELEGPVRGWLDEVVRWLEAR